MPLDQAPIDHVTARERAAAQDNLSDALAEAEAELELGELDGCSPWSCRSGASVRDDFDITA